MSKVETKEILQAVEKVMAAVDSKSVVAQTDHLIFSEGLLSAYNGRISISTPIDIELEFSVPATDLHKTLKSVDDKEVEFSLEDGVLHIVSSDVRATLSTEVGEEAALTAIRNFDLNDLYDGKALKVADNFIEAVELGVYSASKNADDPQNLNCICVDNMTVTAGDGYRATCVDLESSMERVLIPLSSAMELTKFFPIKYIITSGWIHLMDEFETIFSIRITKGKFPDVAKIIDSFESADEVELPEALAGVVSSLGNIAESPIELFKTVEINLLGDSIECHVDKSGVSVTKTIDFEGGDTDASILISAPMLVSILGITKNMSVNESFAKFSDDTFTHMIALVQ